MHTCSICMALVSTSHPAGSQSVRVQVQASRGEGHVGPLPYGEGPFPHLLPRPGHGRQCQVRRPGFAHIWGALAYIHACRELVSGSSSTSHQELCDALSSIPSQLSVDDIDDLFNLAQYYASRTPQSFRKASGSFVHQQTF